MFCFVFYCKFQILQLFAVLCFMSKWHSTKRKIIIFFKIWMETIEDLEKIWRNLWGKNKSLRETLKIQQWKESSGLMAIDKTVILSLGRDLLILHLYLKFSLTIDAYWNLNFKFKMRWRGKVCLNRVFWEFWVQHRRIQDLSIPVTYLNKSTKSRFRISYTVSMKSKDGILEDSLPIVTFSVWK